MHYGTFGLALFSRRAFYRMVLGSFCSAKHVWSTCALFFQQWADFNVIHRKAAAFTAQVDNVGL
jgi:hypothetical protein